MRNLDTLFAPKSIAVIGASDDPSRIRGRLLKLLIDGGFDGKIYPVNPNAKLIQGLPAVASVRDIEHPVELALVAVPAAGVMEAMEDCEAAGVRAVVIISAGSNADAHGARLHDRLAAFANRTGIRVLGPNSEGFFASATGVVATFSPTVDAIPVRKSTGKRRPVAIVSHSGAMAMGIYSRLAREQVPVSSLVSTGNEADIDLIEVVEHLVAKNEVAAILLFIEGLKRPERFAIAAAKAADAGIPLIVYKVGSSLAGQRAAVSHTAHLTGADTAYDAAFRRFGIIRVTSPEQMYAVALAASCGARPAGKRVGIITTSGGAGGWASDLSEMGGLTVPELDPAMKSRLSEIVPNYGSAENPVDVTAAVVDDGGITLMKIVDELVNSDGIDIGLIIVSLVPPKRITSLAERIEKMLELSRKPIFFHSPGEPSAESIDGLARLGTASISLPGFVFAMQALADHESFCRARHNASPDPLFGRSKSRQPILPACGGTLTTRDARALLEPYGIPMPGEAIVHDRDAATVAANKMGFPVALKIVSADVPHKTDAGGVVLSLNSAEAVSDAFERIMASVRKHAPGAVIDGVQVQQMMPPGREMVVGVVSDPDFGPLIMLGFGGVYVEVLRDVVFELAPLNLGLARGMIERLAGKALLDGVRGERPSDTDALASLLVAISELVVDAEGRIREIDLNPVLVYESGKGVSVVDALIVASNPEDFVPHAR